MPRGRRAPRNASPPADLLSKMAPPSPALRPHGKQSEGGGKAADAALKLKRFAHDTQAPQAHEGPPRSQGSHMQTPQESPQQRVAPTQLSQERSQSIETVSQHTQGSPQGSQRAHYQLQRSPDISHSGTLSNPFLPGGSGEHHEPPLLSPMSINPASAEIEMHQATLQATPDAEPTMRDVYAAISSCNATLASLNAHIGDLKHDMSYVRKDLQAITVRVTATEERISEVEDQISPMTTELKRATQQIAFLLHKVDDLENRSRRSNIRLVGVPEKSEGKDPVSFFESWLINMVGKERLSPFFAIERAHRVPMRAPPPGAPPRPILLKLLNFRDRDVALRAAREKGELSINGHRISLYPDFSGEIQRQRLQFQDIKKRLRALDIPYSMQYPAKLRVVAMNTTHFFDTPRAALHWMDTNERLLRGSAGPG